MKSFPAEPLTGRLLTGLAKLGLAIKTRSWRQAAGEGLTPTQGQILAQLLTQGQEGASLRQLAAQIGVRPPTATEAVAALERKGLVTKSHHPGDARRIRIRLTRKGTQAAQRAAAWPDVLAGAVDGLEPSEQASLLGVLIKMIRRLQEQGAIPVARMCVQCRYFRPNVHRSRRRPHHCAFVDAAFGEQDFRLDCPDFEPALISMTQRRQTKCPSQDTPTEPQPCRGPK